MGNSRSQRRQHSTCGFEFGLHIAASAQTEVANPGESWWQHMQQESSDKLDSFDSHLLASSFGGIVFERKGDVSMVNNQDAVVGNGDAMCIAAQIPKDIFRAGERRFGVDDPVLFIELVEEVPPDAGLAECGGAACQLELTGLVGLAQSSQELAPKQSAKYFDRQEKSLSGCDPRLAIGGESAAGNHAMQVGMEHEVLSPGVQYGGETDFRSQVPGRSGNLLQSSGDGSEQDIKKDGLVAESQCIQFVGNGKDHVEVRNRQQ